VGSERRIGNVVASETMCGDELAEEWPVVGSPTDQLGSGCGGERRREGPPVALDDDEDEEFDPVTLAQSLIAEQVAAVRTSSLPMPPQSSGWIPRTRRTMRCCAC
jgi:hypothetical protein